MRTIFYLLQKEFIQIFRNKGMMPILFVMPFLQLIILVNAATLDIKHLKLFFIDKDLSTVSRLLTSKFSGSDYFDVVGFSFSTKEGDEALEKNKADFIIEIPDHFERDLFRENHAQVQLVINAIDGTKAALAFGYSRNIIFDFNQEIREQYGSQVSALGPPVLPARINITYSDWFNPRQDYKTFMVPGILVLLVTMIGSFLSAMNVVREKEIGTIEQLNVTPIRKREFIVGKLLPFWLLGLFELGIGLLIGWLLYDIPVVGSIWLIFAFSGIYLLAVLGLGLFISTITETQQQAMFLSWFCMVIFILMGGLFTAIENMPPWAQFITYFNPIRYFIEVIRMVMLKGAAFRHIQFQFFVMVLFALFLNGLAVWRYRKTTG